MKDMTVDQAYNFTKKLHGKPDAFGITHDLTWENAPLTTYSAGNRNRIDLPAFKETLSKSTQLSEMTVLECVSMLLWASYGCISTRLYPTDVTDENKNTIYKPKISLHRTVASGGARYPANIYLSFKRSDYIYAYSPSYHSLIVHSSKAAPLDEDNDITIYISSKFARTAFKYKSFAYRLTAVDCGLVLGRLWDILNKCRCTTTTDLVFNDANVNNFLCLNQDNESVYAVLKVSDIFTKFTKHGNKHEPKIPELIYSVNMDNAFCLPEEITAMHNFTIQFPVTPENQSTKKIFKPTDGHQRANNADLKSTLNAIDRRESLANYFTGKPVDVTILLSCLNDAYTLYKGIQQSNDNFTLPKLNLYCAVLNVLNGEKGFYQYDFATNNLIKVNKDIERAKITNALHLSSANIGLSSFIIHIVGNLDWRASTYGPRYYRMQQLLVGAMIDAITITSSRLGISAHPYLGFNKDKLKKLYNKFPVELDILAQVCVGIPRVTNWISTSVII